MEEEREKRVAHAQHMAMMRLTKRDLVLGWTCWHDKYQAYSRSKRLLQGAGARLLKPKLVAAVKHWRRDWEVEVLSNARMSQAERLTQEANARQAAEAEANRLREELKQARQAMLDGTGREAELSRLNDAKLAEEREKRVASIQHMAMMRFGKRDLSLGFFTWKDGHLNTQRQLRILRAAVGRLSRPKLARAVVTWRRLCDSEGRGKGSEAGGGREEGTAALKDG